MKSIKNIAVILLTTLFAVSLTFTPVFATNGKGKGGSGGGGGNTGGGGGSTPSAGGGGSVSVGSAPSASGLGGTRNDNPVYPGSGKKDRWAVDQDMKMCDPFGDMVKETKVTKNGETRFTYGGLEFHEPTFAQCMQDKGYFTGSPGRNSLTNFGTRP